MTLIATFAAGCFWGVEDAFMKVPGVEETTVGYSGGHLENPSYEDVCSDTTGHAEVVEVKYDPEKVSFEQLLEVFWNCHNPTQKNRQGPDVGTQYRSAIFYHSPEQRAAAIASKAKLQDSKKYKDAIATEIVAASQFYSAEEYHQKYFQKHPSAASCHIQEKS